jgi:type I restriction enzyme S subunit
MNAQQLKNAILQEAIEGRLVPQDPNDEPASILLARIRKEKERLVKEGKLKKKDLEVKPISEDEIPFEIPESWEWVRLGYVCSRFSTGPFGTMVHREDYVISAGHPLVNPTNIKKGKIILEGIKMVSDSKYKDLGSYVLQIDDLVLARRGDLSKIAIVTKEEDGWLAGTGAFFMHIIGKIFLPYFEYLYTSDYCQSYLLDQSVGGTMSNLNQKLLADFLIPLPPLAEQHRIVSKIEELLPKVEEYGKAQDALNKLNAELPERLKKSILQEAIEGRLVPQDPNDEPASVLLDKIRQEKAQLVKAGKLKKKDLIETPITEDEIPFEIPESWEWCNLGYLITLLSGRDLAPSEYNDSNDGIPYMTGASNFESGSLLVNRWTTHPVTISHKGDLLITCKGTIGEMAFNTLGDIHIARQIMAINSHFLDLNYVRIFLMRTVSELEKKAKSIIPGISREDILDALFPLPPLSEQHRIVEKLEQLLGEIDKLKK